MKMTIISIVTIWAVSGWAAALAQTNNFEGLVQQGLIEEESNHQLDAAIQNYTQALQHLVDNRRLVATAVFRLGECYRRQGKTSEALAQYQRILRDFPEEAEYTRLSRQWIESWVQPPPLYVLSFGNANADPADNLQFPGGIAVDPSGNVYVSDTKNDRIQKFTGRGEFITRWGSTGRSPGRFDYPQGLAVDPEGNVYVADTHNNRVQKFSSTGEFILEWGETGNKPGQFNSPYAIAIERGGTVLVADARNHRIERFSADGEYTNSFGFAGHAPAQLDQPKSVCVDASGNIYVGDTGNKCIQKFSADGKFLARWGSYGQLPGQFDLPHDVAVDRWGNIYVADADGPSHNNRVQMLADDGSILTVWGSLGSGPGEFNFAARVAVDATGYSIYVCDASNNRVQLFTWTQR